MNFHLVILDKDNDIDKVEVEITFKVRIKSNNFETEWFDLRELYYVLTLTNLLHQDFLKRSQNYVNI